MRALAVLCLVTMASANKPPPLDPPHVRWDMTIEAAEKALTKAKLSPRQDTRRGYFSDGKGGFGHTTEPELHWKIPNGRAEARWQWSTQTNAYRLDEVQLYTDVTDLGLASELAALEKKYGKPHKVTADHHLWVRGGIWLVAIPAKAADPKTNLWNLSVHYRRDDRPAP